MGTKHFVSSCQYCINIYKTFQSAMALVIYSSWRGGVEIHWVPKAARVLTDQLKAIKTFQLLAQGK